VPGESQKSSADYETLAQITALVPPRFGGYAPGGDGFADCFPVAAPAAHQGQTGPASARQGRFGDFCGRWPNMKQNACSGVFS
jgi:hypothetical protein